MIKKLLIALVALSFLVGNFALADSGNPPDKPNADPSHRPTIGINGQAGNPELFKPSDEDCGWQYFQCELLHWVYTFSNDPVTSDFSEVAIRISPTTTEQCRVDAVGFVTINSTLLGYPSNPTGDLEVIIYREDPVYDDYPDIFAVDGGVLYSFVVSNADINFYDASTVLDPYTYIDDSYPTWPVGGIQFPNDGSDMFVALKAVNATDAYCNWGDGDLADGCTFQTPDRSLVFDVTYGDFYYLDYGGGDFDNLGILAYTCCELPAYTCPGNQEWPTHGQNYARTSFSTNTIGDLTNFTKLWEFQGQYFLVWGHPVIANELVYVAFYDEIVCLNLYDGSVVWRTGGSTLPIHPGYEAFMNNSNNNLRTVPTVADGKIYFGTGRSSLKEGFVCADAFTGDTIWVRHSDLGSALPGGIGGLTGEMQYTVSVIVGNNVYFGTSFGLFYALDKNTGATVWYKTLDQGVMFSPTTDGISLYVGTTDAEAGVGGTLYKLDATNGDSLAGWGGLESYHECFDVAPVYNAEEDAIYVNGTITPAYGQSGGVLMKLAAADLSQLFGSWKLTQNPVYVSPNLLPQPWNRITVGGCAPGGAGYAWGPYSSGNATLSSTKQFSLAGSLAWYGDFAALTPSGGTVRWDISWNTFASTCDPYIFAGYGYEAGTWRIMDGTTGDVLVKYDFSGNVLGNAIAEYSDEDYVVTTTFDSQYGNTYGKVFCFKVGANRPRLHVPESVVYLPSVSFIDSYPQSRFADVFDNAGGATLNWTMAITTAKAAPMATGNSGVAKFARELANNLAANGMSLLDNRAWTNATSSEKGAKSDNLAQLAEYVRFPGGLATTSGSTAPGAVRNQEFVLDPAMMQRGANAFEVTIDSDDPDFNPEVASPYPHATPQTAITVVAVKGYDYCDGYINFGAGGVNTSYANNDGYIVNSGVPDDGFAIDGELAFVYHASWFYTYEEGEVAWLDEGGPGINQFEENSVCDLTSFSADIYNATGLDRTITGDRFAASFIDSMKDLTTGEFDPNATIGMEMSIKEYGGYDDDFANFAYVYVELTNRGSDPIPADLLWGLYVDWDVASYGDNIGVGLIANKLSAYRMFDNTAPNYQYGVGSVPMVGNRFTNGNPTKGAYGTYQIANDPVVYDGIIVDSFFNYISDCPPYTDCYYPGTEVGVNPGQDMSAILVADKAFVDGNATLKGGIVIFGLNDAASPNADVAGIMNFANKFAGFGRGDVNNDNVINILDLCVLNCYVAGCGCSPYPFLYLGDVNVDGNIDSADVTFLFNYLFMGGPLPMGDWVVR